MTQRTIDSLSKRFGLAWAGAFVATLLVWWLLTLGSAQNLAGWVLTASLIALAAVPAAAIAALLIPRHRGLMVLLAAVLTMAGIALWFFGMPRPGTPVG